MHFQAKFCQTESNVSYMQIQVFLYNLWRFLALFTIKAENCHIMWTIQLSKGYNVQSIQMFNLMIGSIIIYNNFVFTQTGCALTQLLIESYDF